MEISQYYVLQVFVASEVTGLIQLGEMARDSIRVGGFQNIILYVDD